MKGGRRVARTVALVVAACLAAWATGSVASAQAVHPISVPAEGVDQHLGGGFSMTVRVDTGTIAGFSVLDFGDPEQTPELCSTATRQVVSGSGGLAGCAGDDLDPNPNNGPPRLYCFAAPCELRISAPTKLAFYAIHGPVAFGGTPWTGEIIGWEVFPPGGPTTTTTSTSTTTTTSTTVPVDPVEPHESTPWRETDWGSELVPPVFVGFLLLLFGAGVRTALA